MTSLESTLVQPRCRFSSRLHQLELLSRILRYSYGTPSLCWDIDTKNAQLNLTINSKAQLLAHFALFMWYTQPLLGYRHQKCSAELNNQFKSSASHFSPGQVVAGEVEEQTNEGPGAPSTGTFSLLKKGTLVTEKPFIQ